MSAASQRVLGLWLLIFMFVEISPMKNTPFTVELKSKNPVVVLQLKQYQSMLEYIEDLEDKAALRSRAKEENIPWSVTEKKFNKKFGAK